MHYHKLGQIPRKRHTVFRKPDQSLYWEHLFGLEGFSSVSSLLYRHGLPCSTLTITPAGLVLKEGAESPLDYLHLKTHSLSDQNWIQSREPLLLNSEVELSVGNNLFQGLFRNASHHELYFLESGQGVLQSEFGELDVVAGDYVLIPKGITYRWVTGDVRYLLIQSLRPMRHPKRHLNEAGQFLEHSPICERDLKLPSRLEPEPTLEPVTVMVRRGSQYFAVELSHNPFDVVGWDGCFYPYAISIHDFEPLVGSLHLPPPVHQIFESPHFVVCNFVPRLFDFHKEAIPAPYYHSNVDSDEVLFYVEGNFMSRSGIEQGSITLHPAGIAHGPQPGKIEASVGARETNELAVMLDTFQPLELGARCKQITDENYSRSWTGKHR